MTERELVSSDAHARSTSTARHRSLFVSGHRILSAGASRIIFAAAVGMTLNAAFAARADAPSSALLNPSLFQLRLPQVEAVHAAPIAIVVEAAASAADVALGTDEYAALANFHRPPVSFDGEDLEVAQGAPDDILEFGKMKVQRWIVDAVLSAAEKTDVDPVYMMALADKESSLAPNSSARTSSAEGLFQFIEQTWLECVQRFGAKHGLEQEAEKIETNQANGRRIVADEKERERILSLRRDPHLAGLMAGEMLQRDRARIQDEIGRTISNPEIYIAHFLGPNSAARFLKLKDEEPKASASKAFPAAARANRAIFFNRAGKKSNPLSVAEVYARIETMIDYRLDRYNELAGNPPVEGAREEFAALKTEVRPLEETALAAEPVAPPPVTPSLTPSAEGKLVEGVPLPPARPKGPLAAGAAKS